MNRHFKKVILLLLAVVLLVGASFVQKSLNSDRERLGLTRIEPLENAPPVLAFTTVALGGFRGLIANALWIRATDLQDEDKFFEMQQLADWITKLEPHFSQVWVHQAWNMSYNISVKFKDFPDRWRWVKAGIELLRDEGLRYNPDDPLIHRELAWHFQHKMGANLDDANIYYKREWATEMIELFGGEKPNFDELINPQTDDARERSRLLREKYKMDPQFMKEVDERFGPLEWRLPEAHSIYWAAQGLKKAQEHPEKMAAFDVTQLRRGIYASMQISFHRGRLVRNPRIFDFRPNLDVFPKVYAAYEEMIADEPAPDQKNVFSRGQRNLVKDAVYFFYVQARKAEAAKWFNVLVEKFPESNLLESDPNSLPRNLSAEEYALARVQEEANDTSADRIKVVIEGLLINSYQSLVVDEDESFEVYQELAAKIWENYQQKIIEREKAIGLPPMPDIKRDILNRLLDPETGIPVEMRVILRTKLQMGGEPTPSISTNAPPVSNNALAVPK